MIIIIQILFVLLGALFSVVPLLCFEAAREASELYATTFVILFGFAGSTSIVCSAVCFVIAMVLTTL